jgi:hypothetical protein
MRNAPVEDEPVRATAICDQAGTDTDRSVRGAVAGEGADEDADEGVGLALPWFARWHGASDLSWVFTLPFPGIAPGSVLQ